jgi:hypothetical protein
MLSLRGPIKKQWQLGKCGEGCCWVDLRMEGKWFEKKNKMASRNKKKKNFCHLLPIYIYNCEYFESQMV